MGLAEVKDADGGSGMTRHQIPRAGSAGLYMRLAMNSWSGRETRSAGGAAGGLGWELA